MKTKKSKVVVANAITIVDEEGNPKIGMYALGSHGYAGISFYKGKGKKRYQALQIYITDHHHGIIEVWRDGHKIALSLGASDNGVGMSVYDPEGRHLRSYGALHDEPALPAAGKKKCKGKRSAQA